MYVDILYDFMLQFFVSQTILIFYTGYKTRVMLTGDSGTLVKDIKRIKF
jgi:hypothetical protein